MSRIVRSLLCVAVFSLIGVLAPVHGQTATLIFIMQSPSQVVEVEDDKGRLRPAQFEANVRVHDDGRVNGGAILDQRNVRFEFRFDRMTRLDVEEGVVRHVVLEGWGVRIDGNREQEFEFVANVTPVPGQGGILIYDIQDGFVYEKAAFEALGTLRLAR